MARVGPRARLSIKISIILMSLLLAMVFTRQLIAYLHREAVTTHKLAKATRKLWGAYIANQEEKGGCISETALAKAADP